ncbi:MAG: DoxX family protein [Candidatus Moraniibacteriota bacterium]
MQACARAPWTPLIARIFLSAPFVVSGFNKLQNFNQTLVSITSLTSESVALPLTALAILFELGGGLMLLFDWKTEHAISILIVFLVLATIMVHSDFSDPATGAKNLSQLLKNFALVGGLLLMARYAIWETKKEASSIN